MENGGDGTSERQVQVRFTTRLPKQLRVEATAFSLPVYLNRYGLSQIVNTLLGLDNSRPFDFLIDGELIRTTLEQLYLSKNLSAESILVLEYVLAVGPPQPQSSQPEDDWVSAVNGAHARAQGGAAVFSWVSSLHDKTLDMSQEHSIFVILSGSYDSFARAWAAGGVCTSVLEGHKDTITSVTIVDSNDDNLDVVTSSKDKTLRLWQVPTKTSSKTGINPIKVFKGHSASVQCAAASPSRNQVCSGSWDSTMKLWRTDTEIESDEDDKSIKKRKLVGADPQIQQSEMQVAAIATYKEHSQCVAAVEWPEEISIFSASWDHSLRQWDVETSINTVTMTCSKALHCLSVGGEGSALLVTGGADPVLRIWDPRVPGTVTPILQLSSHKAWITACKWHRQSDKHLLSASHDGSLKLWDIRSKVPLQTLQEHKDKVLCADWWKSDAIVSGGADCQLKVFKYADII